MRQYEATYLISDSVNESGVTKVTGRINGYISDKGGKVIKEESWGRRKLAYPIKSQKFSTYITVGFEIDPEFLSKIEREFKLTPEVVRYLLIVKDFGKEELKLSTSDIAETEDIEKVIGGKKSFEAVEGMTKESKNLMTKREEEEKEEEEKVKIKKTADKIEPKKELAKEDRDEDNKDKKEKNKSANEEAQKIAERPARIEKKKTSPSKKKEEKKTKATPKKATPKIIKEESKVDQEAERLAKLDEELEDILGEDI